MDLLEIYAAASDYHLALVNAADCALALNDRTQACTYLDYLPPELDLRVEYPRAVMLEALQIPGPEPDSCRVKCFHYEGRRAYYRSRVPSRLAAAPLTRPYSLEGLEGELVSLLRKKPQSKELLQERLWPGASHTNQLDNRLHRLVSRVRKKCPISFERGLYSLRNDQ